MKIRVETLHPDVAHIFVDGRVDQEKFKEHMFSILSKYIDSAITTEMLGQASLQLQNEAQKLLPTNMFALSEREIAAMYDSSQPTSVTLFVSQEFFHGVILNLVHGDVHRTVSFEVNGSFSN